MPYKYGYGFKPTYYCRVENGDEVKYIGLTPNMTENLTIPPEYAQITLEIKRVIFNDPATIVLWADGTKTVVKVHDEPFDAEKGLAMAILKKLCGKAQLRREFKKWITQN